jgi:maleate cis-trans isomerase
VACFVNHLPWAAAITPEFLKAMGSDIARAASLMLRDLSVNVMASGCASGSFFSGPENFQPQIYKARPYKVCTPPL